LYLFILESIGMQELLLIGAIALIVFGPKKLPDIAKTLGKTMKEFRKATDEFKSTWEREASLDDITKDEQTNNKILENPVAAEETFSRSSIQLPEVKSASKEDFTELRNPPNPEIPTGNESVTSTESTTSSAKSDWL
jgi:TatA/E family protein of Tat protein translocase